jgi:hypothetical protein
MLSLTKPKLVLGRSKYTAAANKAAHKLFSFSFPSQFKWQRLYWYKKGIQIARGPQKPLAWTLLAWRWTNISLQSITTLGHACASQHSMPPLFSSINKKQTKHPETNKNCPHEYEQNLAARTAS